MLLVNVIIDAIEVVMVLALTPMLIALKLEPVWELLKVKGPVFFLDLDVLLPWPRRIELSIP